MPKCFLNHSWLPYLLFGSFIIGWWMWAFSPVYVPSSLTIETSQSLTLKTTDLLEELSPLQRNTLQNALAGNFSLMIKYIDEWEQDALLLSHQGIKGIQRLPTETYLQAHVLGHLLEGPSQAFLRHLNCKMNLDCLHDDNGHAIRIENHFQSFLPQTYMAASFLLAIAQSNEIMALPKGLRQLKQIYPQDALKCVAADVDRISSEKLYLNRPHLAFVASYSHPPALEVLRNQNIQLYSIKYVNTVSEIQEALLKVGHASNHILEAQLLSIFMEACLLSIDNRLLALQAKVRPSQAQQRLLYLSYHQHYTAPTTKCLTGQLMTRALKHCQHLKGFIPESQREWRIPFEQEQILRAAPDILIISIPQAYVHSNINNALQETQAFQSKRIFYVDEAIQESPTQYIVLAYFDLYQILATTCL